MTLIKKNTKSKPLGNKNDAYNKYLASKDWIERREKLIDIKGRRCVFCGCKDNLLIHHQPEAYQYLGDEENHLDLIAVFCKKHHYVCHLHSRHLFKQ